MATQPFRLHYESEPGKGACGRRLHRIRGTLSTKARDSFHQAPYRCGACDNALNGTPMPRRFLVCDEIERDDET